MRSSFLRLPDLRFSFLRYSMIGGIGFVADLGLLALLTHGGFLPPLVARLGSIFGALMLTWTLHRGYTFGTASRRRFAEWCRYLATKSVGAGINYVVYSVLVLTVPAVGIYGAMAGGSLVAWLANYFGARHFVFPASAE